MALDLIKLICKGERCKIVLQSNRFSSTTKYLAYSNISNLKSVAFLHTCKERNTNILLVKVKAHT